MVLFSPLIAKALTIREMRNKMQTDLPKRKLRGNSKDEKDALPDPLSNLGNEREDRTSSETTSLKRKRPRTTNGYFDSPGKGR